MSVHFVIFPGESNKLFLSIVKGGDVLLDTSALKSGKATGLSLCHCLFFVRLLGHSFNHQWESLLWDEENISLTRVLSSYNMRTLHSSMAEGPKFVFVFFFCRFAACYHGDISNIQFTKNIESNVD